MSAVGAGGFVVGDGAAGGDKNVAGQDAGRAVARERDPPVAGETHVEAVYYL